VACATLEGETIHIELKHDRPGTIVGYKIVLTADFDFISDYEYNLGDMKIVVGVTGITISGPGLRESVIPYNNRNIPESISFSLGYDSSAGFINLSDQGIGIGVELEYRQETYTAVVYPYITSIPSVGAISAGSPSISGSGGIGLYQPMRNPTLMFM